ncbi:MAG: anaerobic glycerol-3-phosphate dehydrogenase subunit C [Desulfovibrio sp.]|nr:anaerobic glycerol-3-phosphate dehydrogenase subunit C [Desulfovibrio sp.]
MSIHLDPDKCLACTTCVVHCPVAEVTPAFLGPRMIGPAFERFRLLGIVEDASLQYCANCKNCEIACPQNVPVATINMLARLAQCQETPPSFRDWIVAHGEVLARSLKYFPAWLKNMGTHLPLMRTLLDVIGIHKDCPMPNFAKTAFRDHLPRLAQKGFEKTVAFFPGCYINYYDPGTGFDLVWLLNQAGYRVLVPKDFVCCGIPLISGGFENDARNNARTNLRVLAELKAQNIPVITACPSCRLMLSREMGEFFPDLLPEETVAIDDAQSFLLKCVATGELAIKKPQAAAKTKISAIYHAPCHLRAQGIGLPAVELLRFFPDIEICEANAGCCGISGSYGFKKEKYAIAQSVGSKLFQRVQESGRPLVVSECGTCRLQIAAATHKPAMHPLTLVRAALEGRPLSLG